MEVVGDMHAGQSQGGMVVYREMPDHLPCAT